MRIRMIKTAAGPDGVWIAGRVYTISDALAKQFIEVGAAISLEPIAIETESMEPQERAVLPRGRPKERKGHVDRG